MKLYRATLPSIGRRWLVPIACALVAAGLLLYLATPRAPEPAAGLLVRAQEPTVVQLQGDVVVWRAAARELTTVQGAVVVAGGDRVQTGPGGLASVAWPRGAVATLDPGSAVMLLPSSADDTVRVQLTDGSLWLDGGAEPSALTVETLTPDGARVAGRRFRAQRDGDGRLSVATTDAPATVTANDGRQELPPGATSEVLLGRQPALPRPAFVPPAVAVAVEGPAGWVLVDRLGRAAGQAPDGGWLAQIPAVRGPLPRDRETAAILPEPAGEYRLLLWGSEAVRPYRVALWPTDGQALYGGPAPSEGPGAVRQVGEIPAGGQMVLELTVQGQALTLVGGPRPAAAVPVWLRAAVPAGPRLVAAPSATVPAAPATRAVIVGRPPQPAPAAPVAAAPADAIEQPAPPPASAAPLAHETSSPGTVAAALASLGAAPATPTGSAASVEAVASASEAAPEPTATALPPSFGLSIPGVPPAPVATGALAAASAPAAASAAVTTPTPLVLPQRPVVPELPPVAPVAAPALSGTVTASRGTLAPSAASELFSAPPALPPQSAVQNSSARSAGRAASVPPSALAQSVPPSNLPQSVPPGGLAAGVPPGFVASPVAANAAGVAGTPADYSRPVAAAVAGAPLDRSGNVPAPGVNVAPATSTSVPGPGAHPAAAASSAAPPQAVNLAPGIMGSSLGAQLRGMTLLSGTVVPASGTLRAAPPLTNNRGAAQLALTPGTAQTPPPATNNGGAVAASRPR